MQNIYCDSSLLSIEHQNQTSDTNRLSEQFNGERFISSLFLIIFKPFFVSYLNLGHNQGWWRSNLIPEFAGVKGSYFHG